MDRKKVIKARYCLVVYEDGSISLEEDKRENVSKPKSASEVMLPFPNASMRIQQILFVLQKVRGSSDIYRDNLYDKKNPIEIRDILIEAIKYSAKIFGVNYSSVQDKLCRQMGMNIDDWTRPLNLWLEDNDSSEIVACLLKNVSSRNKMEDTKAIEDFF